YKKINNFPKISNVSTSSDTVEDVLIDCWKHAEGNDKDTKMLELIEDIPLDLVDKTNTIYNAGDFVYLKAPNNETYEVPVTETTKKLNKRGEGSVNVGQVTNTPLNRFMG
ncbi:MAG: hypothetical protein LBM02_09410, partial [Lachnospiraceae bacterium]|nr:hypothetical protein [Lachnospiraceae bacterium]